MPFFQVLTRIDPRRLLQTFMEAAPDCIQILRPDGTRLFMNKAGLEMIEATSMQEANQRPLLEYIDPEDRFRVLGWLSRIRTGEAGALGFTLHGLRGGRRWVEARAVPLRNAEGEIDAILILTRDLSEHHQTERALEKVTCLYRMLSEVNQTIIRRPGKNQLLQQVCRIAIRQGGFQLASVSLLREGRLKLQTWATSGDLGESALRETMLLKPLIKRVLGHGQALACNDLRMTGKTSDLERWGLGAACLLPLKVHGAVCGVVTICAGERDFFDDEMRRLLEELAQDLSFALEVEIAEIDRRLQQAELEFLAHRDPLTHLPNRRLLRQHLTQAIHHARRRGKKCALMVLDLDRFKDVNDSFGHAAGDRLLCQVAERFQARLRVTDILARLGGDEFALVLEDLTEPEDAGQVVAALIATLEAPWTLEEGVEVQIGVSCGIALFPDHGADPEELFQHADAALYQAKAQGRGQFCYFNPDLTERTRKRLQLATCLRRTIRDAKRGGTENQLQIYLQPQLEMATRRLAGAEALARWRHPERGMILPAEFIPVAEQTGLIADLDLWVLDALCRQGRAWLDAGLRVPTLAVNLSPREFQRRRLDVKIADILLETGFPAHLLELELTETTLMEHEQEAIAILARLRDLGVRLALDDFGTGYSSLAHLKRFPLDLIKIDKRFVDDLPQLKEDCEIAAAIIAMGHALGLKVLAEGVETRAQLEFLARKGCDLYQGYLYSPPVPSETFAGSFLA